MYLTLYIEGKEHGQWYLDDDHLFTKPTSKTFQRRCIEHKEIIDQKVEEIRQAYWCDIEASKYWTIILAVKSRVRRINLNLT